jgi:hypothetical protein
MHSADERQPRPAQSALFLRLARIALSVLLMVFIIVATLTPFTGPSIPFLLWSVPAFPVLVVLWILLPSASRDETKYYAAGVVVIWVALLAGAALPDRYLRWTERGLAVTSGGWSYLSFLGFPVALMLAAFLLGSREGKR